MSRSTKRWANGKAELTKVTVCSDTARVTAVKCGEDGSGLAMRVVKCRGKSGEVTFDWNAENVKLLEEKTEQVNGGMRIKPFEIATLEFKD